MSLTMLSAKGYLDIRSEINRARRDKPSYALVHFYTELYRLLQPIPGSTGERSIWTV